MIEGREIVCERGAATAEPEAAARIGAEIFAAGGNAMDAAAAACLASCVLEPEAADIGGYVLCAVVLEGASGRVWSVDANAVSPAAANERMFETSQLDAPATIGINAIEYGVQVKGDANLYGPLAVAVPGVMGGIGALWERCGKLRWEQVVEPSLRALAEGFPYRTTAQAIRTKQEVIERFPETARHLMPERRLPAPDDKWHRRDLEKTLARLARAGWRDFYEGDLGRVIADFLRSGGGLVSRTDMASFRPRVTEPYRATYRGVALHSATLPNGGISVLQILNMLELFDAIGDDDPRWWHRFAEVLKLAWRDRLRYLGDPDFANVPLEYFLEKARAAERAAPLLAKPDAVDTQQWLSTELDGGTAQISTADADGNLVAVTISHGGLFGSCLTVPGTGVILGHGMCRFDPRPGRPNSIGPRKRPLNNVAPTILRLPDRDIATGLRGGRKIISVCAQLCARFVDFAAGPLAAATAPRLHVETQEPLEVLETLDGRIVDALAAMGHTIKRSAEVAVHAHTAECSRGGVRAGGNIWAAGV